MRVYIYVSVYVYVSICPYMCAYVRMRSIYAQFWFVRSLRLNVA